MSEWFAYMKQYRFIVWPCYFNWTMAGKHIEQKPPESSSLTSRHPEIDYLQANWTFQPTAWRVILHMSMDNPPNKKKLMSTPFVPTLRCQEFCKYGFLCKNMLISNQTSCFFLFTWKRLISRKGRRKVQKIWWKESYKISRVVIIVWWVLLLRLLQDVKIICIWVFSIFHKLPPESWSNKR